MPQPDGDSRKLIRKALNHLYNPDFLRRSPLISLFGLAERFDAPKVLQRILIQAIETVQYRPAGSRDERRTYYHDLLSDRYVTKLSQEAAAEKLGISLRQLAREQDHAIDLLATVLAEKYPALASTLSHHLTVGSSYDTVISVDLSRFTEEISILPLRLSYVLEKIASLIKPLADQKQITIETVISSDVRGIMAHPIAIRQTLLAVIHAALQDTGTQKLNLQAANNGEQVQISVQVERHSAGRNPLAQADAEIANRLIELNGGQMNWTETSGGFLATLSFPAFQSSLVLVLDDDPDFLHLLEQLLQDTRYQIVAPPEPALTLEWVDRYAVECVILDVMAPGFDGWQLLKELYQYRRAWKIPVLVCTMLSLDELAYSWGARAVLRKPVMQDKFLAILNQTVEQGR